MTLEIADPSEPEMAWPSAGSAGPPSIDVLDSCSWAWCHNSKAS
jgi:hypothetical protein